MCADLSGQLSQHTYPFHASSKLACCIRVCLHYVAIRPGCQLSLFSKEPDERWSVFCFTSTLDMSSVCCLRCCLLVPIISLAFCSHSLSTPWSALTGVSEHTGTNTVYKGRAYAKACVLDEALSRPVTTVRPSSFSASVLHPEPGEHIPTRSFSAR